MNQNQKDSQVNLPKDLDNSLDNYENILEESEFNKVFDKLKQQKQRNQLIFKYELCKLSKEIEIPAEDLSNLFQAYLYNKDLQELRKYEKFQNSNYLQKKILEFNRKRKYDLIEFWSFLQTPINFKTIERYIAFFAVIVGIIIPIWQLRNADYNAKEEQQEERERYQRQLDLQKQQLIMQMIKESWETINEYEGKEGNYGRKEAIENLNKLKASLNRVNLNKADLAGINLTEHGAKLAYAKFNDAELANANFSGANLNKSEFKGAKLSWAKFNCTNIDNSKKCTKIQKANFINAELPQAELIEADLTNTNFTKADLTNTNFTEANLTNTNFTKADLGSASLTEATLINTIFGDENCTETQKNDDWKKNKDQTLNCADLNKAKLQNVKGLTPEQVKKAYNWQSAIYSEDFCEKFSEEELKPYNCSKDSNSDS
ncbi:MAG: pentapeptide repeat-containing protein [Okeania sp. SIO3B3]|nr:pentapeptide repeat-containing protein [Okeania sp. SIO3B3]